MKKALSILFSIFFVISLFSCGEKPSSGKDEPEPGPTPQPQVKDSNVIVKNTSNFDVNIYVEKSPYYDVEPNFMVSANKSYECKLPVSTDTVGTIFYIEYLIDIGNAKFPYRTLETQGYKYLLIKENEKAELVIDPLNKCESNSAYFYVENDTDSSIHVLNGSFFVAPVGTKDYNIPAGGGAGVFEVNETTTAISFGNYTYLRVVLGNDEYPLPIDSDNIQKGNVYSFVLSTDSSKSVPETLLSLKSITPFNIDTQKQIWTRTTLESTDLTISGVRPKKDVSKGYLAAFSSKEHPNAIMMKDIDVYGETKDTYSVGFQTGSSSDYELKELTMMDFIEASDGSSVILGSAYSEKKDDETDRKADYYLLKYDFVNRNLSIQTNISKIVENVILNFDGKKVTGAFAQFASDRQNTLIEYETNKYALTGCAYFWPDYDNCYNYSLVILLDYTESLKTPRASVYVSTQPSKNLEQVASSIFYSKKDSSFYVTEYYDWDSAYESSIPYKSRLLKIDSELGNKTVVLDEENMLFLGITGDSSTGKYYIAGENYSTGTQKGLMISSSNVTSGEKLKSGDYSLYFAKGYSYAWFNQVCICGNNIVACGAASSKKNAEELPVVVAFNSKGELQWQNTDYSGYTSAKSCFATAIGTYLVNLVETEGSSVKACAIVSADLLGKATGNVGVLQ